MCNVIHLGDLVPNTERYKKRIKPKCHEIIWNILDDTVVQTLKPVTDNALLIRVLEPIRNNQCWDKDIRVSHLYKDILIVRCDDIENKVREGTSMFSTEDALAIKNILQNNYTEIVVHCGAGISRSAGVMLGIARGLGYVNVENYISSCDFYIPNKHICETLTNTIQEW